MRKFNLTTQAFISSIISIVLCLVMLMGTTFAWYTDEARVVIDDVQAGEFEEESTTKSEEPDDTTTTAKTEDPDDTTTTVKSEEPDNTTTTVKSEEPDNTTTTAKTEDPDDTTTTVKSEEPDNTTTTVESEEPDNTTTTVKSEESDNTTTTAKSEEPDNTTTTAKSEGTDDTTTTTKEEETTNPEQDEFPIIVEGEEYNVDSQVVCNGKEVKAESVVIVRKAIDSIELTDITADVENGIVIEDKLEVQVITLTNCDFELASGGKLVRTTGNAEVKVILENVTVNGEEITSQNYNKYFNGLNDVEII